MTFVPNAPGDGKYPGLTLPGLQIRVQERDRYDPTKLAVALLAAIRASHPAEFQLRSASFDRLAAGPELRTAIETGRPLQEIWGLWEADLTRFRESRGRYLIYP